MDEAATFEAEFQAIASGRGISITAEAAARFYARPGLRFPRIVDILPCEVAVALPPDPTPGHGRLDWASIFGALDEIGFEGAVSLECSTEGDPAETLPATAERLRALIGA